METERHFRLFDLPAELRNTIFELVFQDHVEYVTEIGPYTPPGILLANKQFHVGATPIFYASTTFYIGRDAPLGLDVFASLPSKFRDAITCVRIAGRFGNFQVAQGTLRSLEAKNEMSAAKLRNGVIQVPLIRGGEMFWMNTTGTVCRETLETATAAIYEWRWVLMRRQNVVRKAEEERRIRVES